MFQRSAEQSGREPHATVRRPREIVGGEAFAFNETEKPALIPVPADADSRRGFPNRLKFVGPGRTAGGSPWRQQLVFGMIMARAGCGRRRNGRRTGRKR